MDGTTVLQKPLDNIAEVVRFVDDPQSLKGFHRRVVKHAAGFAKLYRSKLTKMQMVLALGSNLLTCAQPLSTSFTGLGWLKTRAKPRTFVSSTEPLDHMYTPAFRVDSRFESYFKPTMVTDDIGQLHQDIIQSGLLEIHAPRQSVARA